MMSKEARAKEGARSTRWYAANLEKARAAARRRRGMPEPTRLAPPCCELCGRPPGAKALAADHDHTTGLFRGWICGGCNRGIGLLQDNAALIHKAADYVAFGGPT
jgi:hypothetical protein